MKSIQVVDAVMGTGKSTWAIQGLNVTQKRTIVVLPYKEEIKRYVDMLDNTVGVIALHDDHNGKNKQERFEDALLDAQVIIATHVLLKDFLKPHVFTLIEEGNWHLLMDEAIGTFEPINGLSKTILDGWKVNGIVTIEDVNDRLKRISPVHGVTEGFIKADSHECTQTEKTLLARSLVHDLLMVNDGGVKGFFSFALSEHRLKSFQSLTVLTYMYIGSDLDYWCRIKGMDVEHTELIRDADGGFKLAPHNGQYGGSQFKGMIQILDVKGKYGVQSGQLSATSSKALTKESNAHHIHEIQKDLRRHFRNRKRSIIVTPDDFMFTSLESCKGIWTGYQLPAKLIGESTWVAFNKRGVNGLAHKHNLAFLFNVYQHPAIRHVVNSCMEDTTYSDDTYALSTLLQWIWRSAIRNGEKIRVYIPSKRMRELLKGWLNNTSKKGT
ncbi:MAG: hypothetical protein MI892_00980 [Desulfobacterales bacterium]|nr:hypothetical protein [Desulfobacterales bacterium]